MQEGTYSKQNSLRIIIGSLAVGGAEKHLSYILPQLAKNDNWQIKVITMTPNLKLAPILQAANIKIKYPKWFITNKYLPRFIKRPFNLLLNISRLCWDFIIDRHSITHFFLPEAYLLGMLSALLTFNPSVKIMSRRSLNYYKDNYRLLFWLEKKLHKFNQIILGNSQAIIQQLNYEELVPSNKLKLIYNGIPIPPANHKPVTNQPKDYLTPENSFARDSFTLVITANLIPYKRHVDLLRALNLIKYQLPNPWQLICIGNDSCDLKQELITMAKAFNIERNINWQHNIQHAHNILALADIGILCSEHEGFSNAILEYMAAGLPVIATDVGGNPEAIIDQQTGFIVPATQPRLLAAAIIKLLDANTRRNMGSKGYARIQEFFSLNCCVQQYKNLYSNLF